MDNVLWLPNLGQIIQARDEGQKPFKQRVKGKGGEGVHRRRRLSELSKQLPLSHEVFANSKEKKSSR